MVLSNDQIIEIKQCIKIALDKLYKDDDYLILVESNERSIAFRFGLYFSEIIKGKSFYFDTLRVDFEYNRNFEKVKGMQGFSISHGVYPDLILHDRGSNLCNLLVVEFKGHWSLEGYGKDFRKLCGFTHQEINDYHYGIGVFILLSKNRQGCELTYFINGAVQV